MDQNKNGFISPFENILLRWGLADAARHGEGRTKRRRRGIFGTSGFKRVAWLVVGKAIGLAQGAAWVCASSFAKKQGYCLGIGPNLALGFGSGSFSRALYHQAWRGLAQWLCLDLGSGLGLGPGQWHCLGVLSLGGVGGETVAWLLQRTVRGPYLKSIAKCGESWLCPDMVLGLF